MLSELYRLLGRPVRPVKRKVKPVVPTKAERLYESFLVRLVREQRARILLDLRRAGHGDIVDLLERPTEREDSVQLERISLHLEEESALAQTSAAVVGAVDQTSRKMLGVPNAARTTDQRIEAWSKKNRELITNLTDGQRADVQKILGSLQGQRVEQIARELQKTLAWSEKRARLVARDQVLKLNGQLTRDNHEALGIRRYRWVDSGDGSVRRAHRRLNGRVFRYDDPPITDPRTGARNNPGEDYQCRCTPEPILDEIEPGVQTDDPTILEKEFGSPADKLVKSAQKAAQMLAGPGPRTRPGPIVKFPKPIVKIPAVQSAPVGPIVKAKKALAEVRRVEIPVTRFRPNDEAVVAEAVRLASLDSIVGQRVSAEWLARSGARIFWTSGIPAEGLRGTYRIVRDRYSYTERGALHEILIAP